MPNNTESLDEVEQELSSGSKAYQYFKDHPSVLIAVVSGIVATVSFLSNALLFFVEYRYLYYWGFDISTVDWSGANISFVLMLSLVFLMVVGIFPKYTSATFRIYMQRVSYVHSSRALHRLFRKTLRQEKSQLGKIRRELRKNKRQRTSSAAVRESEKKITKIQNKMKDALERLRSSRKLTSQIKWLLLAQLILAIIPAFLAVAVEMCLLLLMTEASWSPWLCIVISLIYALALSLLSYFLIFFFEGLKIKREIKAAQDDIDRLTAIQEEAKNKILNHEEYPIDTWTSYGLKDVVSDKNLKSAAELFLFNIVAMSLLLLFSANATQKDKKTFSLYSEGDSTYAIVYQNKTSYYMDKVDYLDEDSLSIDTSTHRILSANDLSYTVRTFETVRVTPESDASPFGSTFSAVLSQFQAPPRE